jgi:CHAT domain-containing protein/Tfp pilus assembly protein PilF
MRAKFILILSALVSTSNLLFSQEHTFQALMDSCTFYQEKLDFQTALQWAEKAEAQAKVEFGEKDTNYISSLNSIYTCYYYMGKVDKAIEYCEKSKPIIKVVRGPESPEYAEVIGNLGVIYDFISNYEKAEQYKKESLDMRRRLFKGDNPDLATSINSMAYFYNGRGRFAEAEPLYKESLDMRRRLFKGDNPDLARSINDMAEFYKGKGRYAEAEPLYKEALEMRRRLFKGDHPDLANSINNIANFYDGRGRYDEAEPLYREALEMYRHIYKGDNPDLAISMNNMAALYYQRGLNDEAEALYKEALEMFRRLFKGDHPDLAASIINMADFYYNKGRFAETELLYKEGLNMFRRIFKGDHPDLATSINNIAMFYYDKGQYAEAESLLKEALEMRRRIFKGDHPDLAQTINNIAVLYKDKKLYDEAEPLYKESLEMSRRIFKGDHPALAVSINNTALFYIEIGHYAEAELLFKEALEMNRRLFKKDNSYLANSINCLAYFYEGRGRYSEAEPLYKEALEMRRRLFKEEHPDIAISIINMAHFYNSRGYYPKAIPLFFELMSVCYNLMNNYYPSLSEKEKDQYFNTFSKYFLEYNNFIVLRYKDSPKLIETMFDNQLLTKGMLLNASNKVRSRILSSNDTTLIKYFNSWKDKKEYIVKLYQMSNAQLKDKNINLDSIIKSANEQEKELTKRSEVFRNEYEKQKFTWKDVQNSLGKEEAIVEIVRFNLIDKSITTDTVYYAILIVKKNSKEPELVLLKNGKELEKEYISNYYKSIKNQIDDNSSYNQIWKPISAKLKGIKKVYVSPDGVYNQINLATLKNTESGKYLLDEKDIVLLSSSRDLVEHKIDSHLHRNDTNMIVELFGDPKFNLDSAQHQKLASNFNSANKADMERGVMDNLLTSGGINPLPGTRTEIENIYTLFKTKNWDVRKHLGEDALEEAVKSLNNPRVLHIATHGLFLQDIEHVNKDERIIGMETKRFVENPLLRSMLLFAGAENTIIKNTLSNTLSKTDDGLLTAYEAMNLNLDNTELVVLSACETGLGTIKNGEGVYGLQRAFIEAGAKTLIMSLWKVNDETTLELMTSFYTKWLAGKTKRQAFKEAQQELKKKHPEPYYWGAFVMVGE